MKNRMILVIYFSLWFCALTFYNENALHLEPSRVIGYGFAILQALMLSKLLLIPEGFLPFGVVFKPTVKGSLYLAIIVRTTIDSILVLIHSTGRLKWTLPNSQYFEHRNLRKWIGLNLGQMTERHCSD